VANGGPSSVGGVPLLERWRTTRSDTESKKDAEGQESAASRKTEETSKHTHANAEEEPQ